MIQVYDFEVLEFDNLLFDIHCGIINILKRQNKKCMHMISIQIKYL